MTGIEVDGTSVEVAPRASRLLDAAARGRASSCPRSATTTASRPGRFLPDLPGRVDGREDRSRPAPPRPPRAWSKPHRRPACARAASALELIVSATAAARASAADERSELARACGRWASSAAAPRRPGGRGRDDSHPYVHLDRDLCIACGSLRADVRRGAGHLRADAGRPRAPTPSSPPAPAGRGPSPTAWPAAAASTPAPPARSVGAGTARPREPDRAHDAPTTCGYCGVGCALDVHTRDGEVAAIRPPATARSTAATPASRAASRTASSRSPDRLTRPLLRRDGALEPVGWDEALGPRRQRAARIRRRARPRRDRGDLLRPRDQRGELPDAEAACGSRSAPTTSTTAPGSATPPRPPASSPSFGLAGGTNPFDDFDRADCFLLVRRQPDRGPPGGRRADQAAGDRRRAAGRRRPAAHRARRLRRRAPAAAPGHQRRRLQRPRRTC